MKGSHFWNAEEYDKLAQRHYESGDYDGALEILRRGEVLHPGAAELKVSIGYTQLAREEYLLARQAFGRALALEPDHEDALVGFGEVCLKLGERARGFAAFERVLELGFARDLDLMLSIGRALYREELFAHAERFFRLAVDANPRSAEAAADLAYAVHRNDDRKEARFWLERAVRLDPQNHDARALLGDLLFEAGEHERALAELESIPPGSLWDPIILWRLIELLRTYRSVSVDGSELEPYLERLDALFGDPDPDERLLMEIGLEDGDGAATDAMPARDQLELFGAPAAGGGAPAGRTGTAEAGWAGIVQAMCESSSEPAKSIEEFMRETARRVRDRTGIELPVDDPEAFLKASARAGVLHIDR